MSQLQCQFLVDLINPGRADLIFQQLDDASMHSLLCFRSEERAEESLREPPREARVVCAAAQTADDGADSVSQVGERVLGGARRLSRQRRLVGVRERLTPMRGTVS